MIVCINGKFVHEHEAKISVFDRGFLYGDGIFETVPASHGNIFWLEEHIKRMLDGCKQLDINPPWTKGQISKFVQDTIDKSHGTEFEKLKIILSRGSSDNPANIDDISQCEPNIIIYCTENKLPAKKFLEQGIKLMTTNQGRPYPKIKTLSYISSVLGTILAKKQGFDDALFIDHDSDVLEGTSFNVFVVKNGSLKTPSQNILAGVTAQKVTEMARNLGFIVDETAVTLDDLKSADEAFVTGSTKRVLPVTQVDDSTINNCQVGVVTKQLMNKFSELYF